MPTPPDRRLAPRDLAEPIVQAPMAGGPSTPALAAAVANAGGLGFLAAGYRSVDAVAADVAAVRAATDGPFGLNLFVPGEAAADPAAVARYASRLRPEAARQEAPLGEPRHDDDGWADKLALAGALRPAVVSFTFGCPPAAEVARLQATAIAVWVTVTSPAEARAAAAAGADALVVQGFEAGGHRGAFRDDDPPELGLLALLQLVAAEIGAGRAGAGEAAGLVGAGGAGAQEPSAPVGARGAGAQEPSGLVGAVGAGAGERPALVAAGGIGDGRGVAAVLAAGAQAAQLGTAYLRTPEAGTSAPHRAALVAGGVTALTRAFSGRSARGLANRFLREHDAAAPRAYPEVHHLTAPLRAAARARGDADAMSLWAGQAHALADEVPAGDLTRRLGAEARAALRQAARAAGADVG